MKGLKKRHNLCLLCVDMQDTRPLRSWMDAVFTLERLVSTADALPRSGTEGSVRGPASLPPPRCLLNIKGSPLHVNAGWEGMNNSSPARGADGFCLIFPPD